jgi:hypothetical protein
MINGIWSFQAWCRVSCKWRLKCRALADSLEEAGEQLFTFTRLPPSQWMSARTTNEPLPRSATSRRVNVSLFAVGDRCGFPDKSVADRR